MKKLFVLAAVVISIGVYINFTNVSMPVTLERKDMHDGYGKSVTGIMPVIRVMTYNIHRGININKELDLDGIADTIKSSGADVIALQEVERFSVRTRFLDEARYIADKLSMNYVFGKSINILNGQYGNAIISKYPIEEYEVRELPSEGEKRTLLRARLNVYGNKIIFYNAHLGLKQRERDLQVEEIIRRIGDEKNFMLAGDFNTTLDKLGKFDESYKDCASFKNNDSKATFDKGGLNQRIDYIFTSNNFKVKEYDVLKSDASDHYPVVSTLEFKD